MNMGDRSCSRGTILGQNYNAPSVKCVDVMTLDEKPEKREFSQRGEIHKRQHEILGFATNYVL